MQPIQVDSGKTTIDDVVKIGDVNVVVKDVGKKADGDWKISSNRFSEACVGQ